MWGFLSCDDETHGDKLLPESWEIGDASTMASPNPNVLLKGGRSPACCEVVGLRDKWQTNGGEAVRTIKLIQADRCWSFYTTLYYHSHNGHIKFCVFVPTLTVILLFDAHIYLVSPFKQNIVHMFRISISSTNILKQTHCLGSPSSWVYVSAIPSTKASFAPRCLPAPHRDDFKLETWLRSLEVTMQPLDYCTSATFELGISCQSFFNMLLLIKYWSQTIQYSW